MWLISDCIQYLFGLPLTCCGCCASLIELSWVVSLMTLEILWELIWFLTPNTLLIKKDISSEIALVTGAGSGIGRETAMVLARLGVRLVLWDVNKTGNEETRQIIQDRGGTSYAYLVDVSNTASVMSTAEKVRREIGEITILINNAGIVYCDGIMKITDDQVRRTLNVNLLGQIIVTKALLPSMLDNNHGHIVNIASIAGLTGLPGMTDYCASKYGSVGFTDALELEMEFMKRPIHTLKVCLGLVQTPLTRDIKDKACPKHMRRAEDCGYLMPDYVAEKIVESIQTNRSFLLLPAALYPILALKYLVPTKRFCTMLKTSFWDTTALLTYSSQPQSK